MLKYRIIVLDHASGHTAFKESMVSEEFVSAMGEIAVCEQLVGIASHLEQTISLTPGWTPLEVSRWEGSSADGHFAVRATFVDGAWVSATDDPLTPPVS